LAAFHLPWHPIFTAVQVVAAVVFMLDFLGVFRYARRRLPHFRAVTDTPRRRFFTTARSLVLVGLVLTLALGFVSSGLAKIGIAAALIVAVLGKELTEWRQDVAALQEEPPVLVPPAPHPEETIAPAPRVNGNGSPPKRLARAIVMGDRVELKVPAGTPFLPVGMVKCDVTGPDGMTYRVKVPPTPQTGDGLAAYALRALAPRWAVVQYPIGFPRAPLILETGVYQVRWEIPEPGLSLLGSRVVHDTFRIAR
jgi:hypothetical protein